VRVEGPHGVLVVLGAINVDLVVSGAPLPRAGETVTGGTFARHHGGKGGNQAVAAARARAPGRVPDAASHPGPGTWMLGAVGDEPLGASALEALRADGVGTDHVLVTPDAPTGVALIAVEPGGENQISVAPGANLALGAPHTIGALEALRPDLLLASLEVSPSALASAFAWCADHGVPVMLNPAPWQPWAADLLTSATYLTPNASELASIGHVPTGVTVVETRGAQGAVIHTDPPQTIAAPSVEAIDATGAGDCFNGVFAAGIVDGQPMADAVRRAVGAAARSVTVAGAREGMPTADELREPPVSGV
jgi:ribokinase